MGSNTDSTELAVRKVFQIPELVEQILTNVRLGDLFRAAGVCRTWKSVFENSRLLQRKAQLIHDITCEWYEDEFDEELGIIVDTQCPALVEDGIIYFELFFAMCQHGPVKLTTNLRKCMATQPGCTEMKVIPWCCNGQSDYEYISRDTGVTVGDVVDAARRVYAEHENCPEMVKKIRQTDQWHQNMARYPDFHGKVILPDGAPARVKEAGWQDRIQRETDDRIKAAGQAGWGVIWDAFRKASEDATANFEDPPRWPNYLADHNDLLPSEYQPNRFELEAAQIPRKTESSNG